MGRTRIRKWDIVTGPNDRETLNSLKEKELEMERLRLLVGPERWPRIYAMLQRIRDQIRREEANEATKEKAA